jgi:hypothetical protein
VIHFIGNGKVCDIALSRYALLPQSGCAIVDAGACRTQGNTAAKLAKQPGGGKTDTFGAAGTTDQRGFSLQTEQGCAAGGRVIVFVINSTFMIK